MTKQHRATPEQWETIELYAGISALYSCIIELRVRIEALDAAHPHQDKMDRLIAIDRDDPSNSPVAADTFRALCSELVKAWDATADFDFNDFGHAAADIVTRAFAALAQSEPAELTDEEILSLADDCGFEAQEITNWDGKSRTVDHGWECTDAQLLTFARAVELEGSN